MSGAPSNDTLHITQQLNVEMCGQGYCDGLVKIDTLNGADVPDRILRLPHLQPAVRVLCQSLQRPLRPEDLINKVEDPALSPSRNLGGLQVDQHQFRALR